MIGARAFAGEIRQPVERALDVVAAEAGAFEIGGQLLALGHFRRLVQHVLVEHVDQNV